MLRALGRDVCHVVLCEYADLPVRAANWLLDPAARYYGPNRSWPNADTDRLARFLGEAGDWSFLSSDFGQRSSTRFRRNVAVSEARHGQVDCLVRMMADCRWWCRETRARAVQAAARCDQVEALDVLCKQIRRQNTPAIGLQRALLEAARHESLRTTRYLLLLDDADARPRWKYDALNLSAATRAVAAECQVELEQREKIERARRAADEANVMVSHPSLGPSGFIATCHRHLSRSLAFLFWRA